MPGSVLVTDYVHPVVIDKLSHLGFVVDYEPEITIESLHKRIKNYQGLIFNSRVLVTEPLLSQAVKLEFIGRLGSGMEIVDRPLCEKMGIAVFSAPNGNSNAVAEHTMAMLLALANNLVTANAEVKSSQWKREENRGFELEGKTIGVYACGHTGMDFIEKLQGFRVRVLAYDKYKRDFASHLPYVQEVSSEQELLEQSHIISLHLPLNPDTKHLVDKTFLSRCKKGVVLLNTSRGNVVNTLDLIEALETGQVSAAGLDVLENEKPNTYSAEEKTLYAKLYAFPNVILSPHVAGWTAESLFKIADIIADQVVELYSSKK